MMKHFFFTFLACLSSAFADVPAPSSEPLRGDPYIPGTSFIVSPYQGGFMEFGLGYSLGSMKGKNTYANGGPLNWAIDGGTFQGSTTFASVRPHTHPKGITGNLSMGYNFLFGERGMVGIIAGGALSSIRGKLAYPGTFIDAQANQSASHFSCRVSGKASINACLRVGGWVRHTAVRHTLFFVKGGWTALRLAPHPYPPAGYAFRKAARKPWTKGMRLGAGCDTYVSSDIMVGLLVDFDFYPKKRIALFAVPPSSTGNRPVVFTYARSHHYTIMGTLKIMFPDRQG